MQRAVHAAVIREELARQPHDWPYDEWVIRVWTLDTVYQLVNKSLREDIPTALATARYVNELRKAIKSHRSTTSMTVYRGMELSTAQRQLYMQGTIFLWPNFVATSKNEAEACAFGNTLFEISLPGVGTTYYAEIESYSRYPHEQEVLLYPYSGFEVVQVSNSRISLRAVDTLIIEQSSSIEQSGHHPWAGQANYQMEWKVEPAHTNQCPLCNEEIVAMFSIETHVLARHSDRFRAFGNGGVTCTRCEEHVVLSVLEHHRCPQPTPKPQTGEFGFCSEMDTPASQQQAAPPTSSCANFAPARPGMFESLVIFHLNCFSYTKCFN